MEKGKTRSGGNPWTRFRDKHPGTAQFLVFFMLSNGITVLQMIIMPVFKGLFGMTDLVNTTFQILPAGHNLTGASTTSSTTPPEPLPMAGEAAWPTFWRSRRRCSSPRSSTFSPSET